MKTQSNLSALGPLVLAFSAACNCMTPSTAVAQTGGAVEAPPQSAGPTAGPAAAPASPPLTQISPAVPPAPPLAAAVPPGPVAGGWARVVSVSTLVQPALPARQVCSEAMEVQAPTTGAGAVAGALVGGAVGSQIGGGSGQALATAAGFVGGALLGDRAEASGRTQTVRQCVVQPATAASTAYQVVYEYGGQSYSAVLPFHPGALLQVQVLPTAAQATVAAPGTVGALVAAPAPTPVMVSVMPVVPPGVVMVSPGVWAAAPAALVVGAGPYWVGGYPYRWTRGPRWGHYR